MGPDKALWDLERSLQIPLALVLVDYQMMSMGPALKWGLIAQWDSFEQTNFSFASGC